MQSHYPECIGAAVTVAGKRGRAVRRRRRDGRPRVMVCGMIAAALLAPALLAGCSGSSGGGHAVPDRHIPPALRTVSDHDEEQRVHRDPAAAVAGHLRHPIMTVANPRLATSAPRTPQGYQDPISTKEKRPIRTLFFRDHGIKVGDRAPFDGIRTCLAINASWRCHQVKAGSCHPGQGNGFLPRLMRRMVGWPERSGPTRIAARSAAGSLLGSAGAASAPACSPVRRNSPISTSVSPALSQAPNKEMPHASPRWSPPDSLPQPDRTLIPCPTGAYRPAAGSATNLPSRPGARPELPLPGCQSCRLRN